MEIASLILKIIVSVAFIVAGIAKLAGAKPLRDQFEEFGLPGGAMLLVGILELAGGVGLFIPALTTWATIGLIGLMLGALANHLKVRHPFSKYVPALMLLILSCVLLAFEIA